MKAWTTNPKNYEWPLRLVDGIARIMFVTLALSIILLVCCSCGSTKMVTQTVEHTSIDTIYLSNVQYDSIYIYQDHVSEHRIGALPMNYKGEKINTPMHTDTLYIKDVSVEYHYKMLRDTIYKTQVDSIPFQVTITEVKEITRPLTWYDHLSRSVLWLNIGFVLLIVFRMIRNLRK